MNLVEHAKAEFDLLGWPGDCEMQKMVCDNVIELLEIFAKQGHSGFSASYMLNLFNRLVKHESISPLTGDDDEWADVSEDSTRSLYQNKRDPSVFKDEEGAYWMEGRVFRDRDGCMFTNSDSRVSIVFPWTKPESPEIIDVTD
jgi:hypothetical protein